jgi:hypothetical protein
MVTSSFDEFISTKVKDAVEKEKEKFLEDLNMCEEEYPHFDESKHKKFEACKIVNDNSLPYQSEPMQTLGLCSNQEFILKGVKIGQSSLNISSTIIAEPPGSRGYFITNKGNVYQNSFMGSRAKGNKPVIYNYKVLEYLGKSSCCGKALKREIVNGGWGEMSNNDVTKNCPASYDKKWVVRLSAAVDGCGCGYNSFGAVPGVARAAPRLQGTDYQHLRSPELYCHYKDHVGWMEDCIDRFMTNNICPDCGSGEVIQDKLDPDINIEIFRNPPIFNVEYIELLELLSKKDATIPIYQIQTIYAKYHPRANENFVIEEKIKKLSQIEKVVEEKERQVDQMVEMKSRQTRKELQKAKENYGEKIKQVNEEKLKRIFSMFILRNERKENINDKSTIREMIKRSNDKCKKKEQEQEIRLKTQQQELNSERIEFEKEKEDYENTFKSKAKLLLDIANDINEINELQEDTTEKSEELFKLMKQLNEIK